MQILSAPNRATAHRTQRNLRANVGQIPSDCAECTDSSVRNDYVASENMVATGPSSRKKIPPAEIVSALRLVNVSNGMTETMFRQPCGLLGSACSTRSRESVSVNGRSRILKKCNHQHPVEICALSSTSNRVSDRLNQILNFDRFLVRF